MLGSCSLGMNLLLKEPHELEELARVVSLYKDLRETFNTAFNIA